ncbi:hypothetical protein A3Q56_06340 [Intoshia linei]|uniref:Uncharacterized protein n=1 Tax=Intoshia linei TaxID=1819745 RepID=A0A177AV80_9BILA|nr:hypothetical protein A3Q56_06340 [Intoshia linei]
MITLTENCFTCRKKLEKKCTFRCITCNQNVCENCGSFNSFDHNEVIDWICLTCQSKEKNDCLPRKLKNKEQISPRCNIYSNKNNVKYNHFMDRKSVLKRQQSLPINVKSKIFQRTRDVKSDITQPKIENEIIDAIFKKCDVNG